MGDRTILRHTRVVLACHRVFGTSNGIGKQADDVAVLVGKLISRVFSTGVIEDATFSHNFIGANARAVGNILQYRARPILAVIKVAYRVTIIVQERACPNPG